MEYNYFWALFLGWNVIGFLMVGLDKLKAKWRRWRIPEKYFFLVSFLGAGIGVYLGMQLFRHKTQHKKFIYGIPLTILVNILVVYLLIKG